MLQIVMQEIKNSKVQATTTIKELLQDKIGELKTKKVELAPRLNCRSEPEPWHLLISHKMHSRPCLPIRNSSYTQAWAQVTRNGQSDGAYLNWRSSGRLMPEYCQGSALPPVFVGGPQEKRKLGLLLDLVLIASSTTAIAPIERVKLLMQSQNAMIQSGRLSQSYNGIFNCFVRTIRNEGFISLWRGNTARVIGSCYQKVLSFAFISYASRDGHWDFSRALGLVLGGAACLSVAYPLSYAGTRLANDIKTTSEVGKWQYNGIVDVWRKTLNADGIAGLYRGLTITLYRNGMILIVPDLLTAALESRKPLRFLSLQKTYLAIALVSSCWFDVCTRVVHYPMDTVSKRMMMTSGEAIRYKNTSDAILQIFKKEGLKSFYKGVGAEMLGTVAYHGLNLLVVYLGITFMKKKNGSSDGGYLGWMEGKGEQL
ncbi:hypothetical protein REPUB_Repub14bG0124100 [Reevesia pubescens]